MQGQNRYLSPPMRSISKEYWQALRKGGSVVGLHLGKRMSLGTITIHQHSISSTQQSDPSQAGSIPSPVGLCLRDADRQGWLEGKEGGMTRGFALRLCPWVSPQARAGHPAGSLPQQMVSPAPAALSRAHTAAGDSGQLPEPGGFCSQRPRHRFARCHTGICHKQDGRLISSTDCRRRSRLPQP